jgi:hypothetical protein
MVNQTQPTKLHQPIDWLGIYPNLTLPNPGCGLSTTNNRTPPTHGLVGHLLQPNLTQYMVSQTQFKFCHPWICGMFVPQPTLIQDMVSQSE